MKYRDFGSTGFKVSALGMGCMRLPTVRFLPQRVDIKKSFSLIRSAIDQGINYIDTAWPYHFGGSERVVGMALQEGYREKVHLATKLFMPLVRKQEDFDKHLNRQLARLQTTYLDAYLFHGLNKNSFEKVKRLNLVDKMLEAREKGKIRFIGFSFHDTLPVFKEIIDFYDWDVAQIQYNYMDTAVQATTEGLHYAASKNMAVVVMEPVKGGQLANPPKEAREVMAQSEVRRSAVDWALQYLWNLPEVSVVLSGMGSQKMLVENCASADNSGIHSLDEDDLNIINELVKIYRKNILVDCTSCQYCMKCPHGVNIPQNFAILNNVSSERSFLRRWMQRRAYNRLADTPERLNPEKTNGNALICTDCGICIEKCPQGIDIPVELKKVHRVLGKKEKIHAVYPPS
jgi:predicted aldo/keto reductase-like oxidoreductase